MTDDNTGISCSWGGTGILHEFLDLEAAFGRAPTSVTLSFDNGKAYLTEIQAFTAGQVPDFVQKWELPVEQETDLILFTTHGDDEQLFFAGLLPYYAGELGYQVQVVYLTDHHNNNPRRIHEMLDGLWAVGVRTYPVTGESGDYHSDSLKAAYRKSAQEGITKEELLGFVLEQLRRFRPKVAVGHDLKGEYGHGMHMMYADLLCKAVEISADPTQYPELAEQYGVWDVPKTYLHLYTKNKIVMDWDQPLERFGGMTAYEVTRDLGFPAHKSQRMSYLWYFRGKDTAAKIWRYSPCEYGLYRSTVGEDVQKNDFFENLSTYAQDREDQEALLRAEEERQRAAAEAEKLRLKEEARRHAEQRQEEAMRKALEEQIAAEQAVLAAQNARQHKNTVIGASLLGLALVGITVPCVIRFIRRRKYKYRY